MPNHDVRNAFLGGTAFGLGLAIATIHHGNGGAVAFGAFLTFGWGVIGAGFGAVSSALDRQYQVVYLRP